MSTHPPTEHAVAAELPKTAHSLQLAAGSQSALLGQS